MADALLQNGARGNVLLAFAAVLLLPFVTTFGFLYSVLRNDESERTTTWIRCRRWNYIVLLATVAAWWVLWDLQGQSTLVPALARYLAWLDPALVRFFSFWLPPAGAVAAIHMLCYTMDRNILNQRWTTSDLLRLTFWRTVSPTVALLLVAAGFDAIYSKSLVAILWLATAAILALVGTMRLRTAQGVKLQRVKSGEAYKRAFTMAKDMAITLKRVYVVPGGKGHLTNAYGLSQSIAITDNYGKFLNSAQLDFMIGHELAHVKWRHGRKNLLIAATFYAATAFVCFCLPFLFFRFRAFLDVFVVFMPILTFCFFSRRFEYEADATAVKFTHDPEMAIQALANLYYVTQAPLDCDRLTEMFMTHPAFTRRARAIGQAGEMSVERLSEVIHEARSRGTVRR